MKTPKQTARGCPFLRRIGSLALIAAFLFPAALPAQHTPTPKKPVGRKDLLEMVREGKRIANCTAAASDIEAVLKQVLAIPGGALTVGAQTSSGPALWLDHCDIQGDLDIAGTARPQSLDALRKEGIPGRYIERMEQEGFRQARVIHIPIRFRSVSLGEDAVLWLGPVASRAFQHVAVVYTEPSYLVAANIPDLRCPEAVFLESFSVRESQFGTADFRHAIFASGSTMDSLGRRQTAFQGDAIFAGAIWLKPASFKGTRFLSQADFRGAVFEGPAFFTGVQAPPAPAKPDAKPEDEEIEERPTGGHLLFEGARFARRAYFDGSLLDNVTFSPPPKKDAQLSAATSPASGEGGEQIPLSYSPALFLERVTFRGAEIHKATFADVDFHDYADFHGAKFTQEVWFDRATFEQEADFRGASFDGMVHLDEISFQKQGHIRWDQLRGHIDSRTPDTYATLKDVFAHNDDLASQNEAFYLHERYRNDLLGWAARWHRVWGILAGYGVRPGRVFWLVFAAYIVFFLLHLREFWKAGLAWTAHAGLRLLTSLPGMRRMATAPTAAPAVVDTAPTRSTRGRLREVLSHSFEATFSLSLEKTLQRGWLYVAQYAVMKPLLLLFAYTLAQTSPVLKALTGVLPV